MTEPEADPSDKPRSRLSVWERADLRNEDRRRMLQNVAAAAFVVAFVCFSFWVIERVMNYSKNVACLQFKQRGCR